MKILSLSSGWQTRQEPQMPQGFNIATKDNIEPKASSELFLGS